jgi:hypothetical protein
MNEKGTLSDNDECDVRTTGNVTYLRSFLRPLSFAALPAVTAAALVLPRGRDLTGTNTEADTMVEKEGK